MGERKAIRYHAGEAADFGIAHCSDFGGPGTPNDWPVTSLWPTMRLPAPLSAISAEHWSAKFSDPQPYANAENKIKRQQLAKAGTRLADLLNAVWP
jgi:hypothetical protein